MDTEESGQSEAILENLAQVRRRIEEAAKGAGRSVSDIEIVAVSKGQPASIVRAAANAGLFHFGENYVQEALAKQDELADVSGLTWHFIGHLQSNKARQMVGRFALIHSIDSERLASKVAEAAERLGAIQDVLVQVHLGDEETKFGALPEEALGLCERIAGLPNLALRGLMGVAPIGEGDERIDPHPYFERLRSLFNALPAENRRTLSMGMSGDFEAAIREGSNMVRIGTALLGRRS